MIASSERVRRPRRLRIHLLPSLSLNYAAVGAYTSGRALCMSGVDACLIEEDGIYPPFP